MPQLSVLMSVYRAAGTVAEAIDSVLTQTFTDFEFLIIDNGAYEDGTSDRLNETVAARHDPRIRIIRVPENRGLANALNLGLADVAAPLVARMDADDISMPQRFALQLQAFQNRPRLAALGSDVLFINARGEHCGKGCYPFGSETNRRYLERASPLAHSSVMMRTQAVRDAGGYRPAFENAEDYDLWLRLSGLNFEIDNIPQPLLKYRLHEGNTSAHSNKQQALRSWLARAFHNMRMSGLNEPVVSSDPLDAGALHLIPESLRADFDIELLEFSFAQLSLKSEKEISESLSRINAINLGKAGQAVAARILLRAAKGFLRHGNYRAAMAAAFKALRYAPAEVFAFLALKKQALFR